MLYFHGGLSSVFFFSEFKDFSFRISLLFQSLLNPLEETSRQSCFCSPSFASGSQEIGDFLGGALQGQQHEVCFSRVASLQCGALFAALKRANL